MKIKVIKFEGFKMPNRAHHNDSGADCFAAKDVILEPHTVTKVPTGIELSCACDNSCICENTSSRNLRIIL